MDDVTGNLFIFVLLKMVRVFENVCEIISDKASESLEKRFYRSHLQRRKIKKKRQKELYNN